MCLIQNRRVLSGAIVSGTSGSLSVSGRLPLGDVGVRVAVGAVALGAERWRRGRCAPGGLRQCGQLFHDVLDLRVERRAGRRRQRLVGAGRGGSVAVHELGGRAPVSVAVQVVAQLDRGGELLVARQAVVLDEHEPRGAAARRRRRRLGRLRTAGALVLHDGRLRAVQRLARLAQHADVGRVAAHQFLFYLVQVFRNGGASAAVEREARLGHSRLGERLGDLLQRRGTPLQHGQHVILAALSPHGHRLTCTHIAKHTGPINAALLALVIEFRENQAPLEHRKEGGAWRRHVIRSPLCSRVAIVFFIASCQPRRRRIPLLNNKRRAT